MNKKLLLLVIVSLFGYQLIQSHAWTVHNNTSAKLDVTVKVDTNTATKRSGVDYSNDAITNTIQSNETKSFSFTGNMAGFCLKGIFIGNTEISENKFAYPKGKGPTRDYKCRSQNIQINRYTSGNRSLNWKIK